MPSCTCLTPHLLTWTKQGWFSEVRAAADFTDSSSYCRSQHFWKPTDFIQLPTIQMRTCQLQGAQPLTSCITLLLKSSETGVIRQYIHSTNSVGSVLFTLLWRLATSFPAERDLRYCLKSVLLETQKQEPYWLSLKIYRLLAHDKNLTIEVIKKWTTN